MWETRNQFNIGGDGLRIGHGNCKLLQEASIKNAMAIEWETMVIEAGGA